jgi:hypothetical protein
VSTNTQRLEKIDPFPSLFVVAVENNAGISQSFLESLLKQKPKQKPSLLKDFGVGEAVISSFSSGISQALTQAV